MTIAMERPTTTSIRGGRYPDLPSEPRDWRTHGHCTTSTLEFIPTIEHGVRITASTARLRQHCTGCPVQKWCALEALKQINTFGSLDGVWAGQASSLTMKLAAFNQLLQTLGAVAELPDTHYLVLPDRLARRRAHISTLVTAGYTATEIARHLGLSAVTVERDLEAVTTPATR